MTDDVMETSRYPLIEGSNWFHLAFDILQLPCAGDGVMLCSVHQLLRGM